MFAPAGNTKPGRFFECSKVFRSIGGRPRRSIPAIACVRCVRVRLCVVVLERALRGTNILISDRFLLELLNRRARF